VGLLGGSRTEAGADNAGILAGDLVEIAGRPGAGIAAHGNKSAVDRECLDIALEQGRSDQVDDKVDAPACCELQELVRPIRLLRVDDVIGSNTAQRRGLAGSAAAGDYRSCAEMP